MSDLKKAPLDLVPLQALVGAARVFEHGNTKVVNGKQREPGDFINRPLDGAFFASFVRHTMQIQKLEGIVDADSLASLDEDSGLPAIDCLITNALIIRAMLIRDGKLPVDPGPGKPGTKDKTEPPEMCCGVIKGIPHVCNTSPRCTRAGCGEYEDASVHWAPSWSGGHEFTPPENKGETQDVTDTNDPVPGARW